MNYSTLTIKKLAEYQSRWDRFNWDARVRADEAHYYLDNHPTKLPKYQPVPKMKQYHYLRNLLP